MDFFAAQDEAHRRTKWLVVYYLIAVACMVVSIYAVVVSLFFVGRQKGIDLGMGDGWWMPQVFVYVVGGTLMIIFFSSMFKIGTLKGGGAAVAQSLGGVKVTGNTKDPLEKQYLNIVEEMSIASGVPMPEVYVMRHEAGINAFAAGFSINDAVVAVTRGCLENLSRDELQGVIAHEFSHILNGDMRLNIRIMGILFGILVIAIIGGGIVRSMLYTRSSSRKEGGMPIALFGFALMIIGYVGVFFARLIQSAVSRQREFLADASAVQFTRYPDGIAGALKKIGFVAGGSNITSEHANETAHFFFASGFSSFWQSIFATHPPLPDRIRAIDPGWDGKFKSSARRRKKVEPQASESKKPSSLDSMRAMLDAAGTVGAGQIVIAQYPNNN